jgi:transposase
MSNFRPINRDTGFLLQPSVDECLSQRHLAPFAVEVIEGLDLKELVKAYRESGKASYHPAMLLGLLVCGHNERRDKWVNIFRLFRIITTGAA